MTYKRIVFLIIILLVLTNSVITAQESNNTQDSNQITTIDPTDITNFGSIWEITKLAGGIRWLIFLVLIAGVASILYKYGDFVVDNKRAKNIKNFELSTASLSKIDAVVANNPSNLVHQLFSNMLNIFHTTERAEDFHHEISNFVQLQQDKFETFKSKMSFLSDTAGALGLLGTVWGMFITFSKGILDNQIILHGMGIALVTTLMGLVVSIILNFFSTQIQGVFRNKIDSLLFKGEELRMQLLRLQQKQFVKDYVMERKSGEPSHIDDQRIAIEKGFDDLRTQITSDIGVQNKQDGNSKYQLINVSGDKQTATVNSRLKQPFVVQVMNGQGIGINGHKVLFSIEKGNGTLQNGNRTVEVNTDSLGIAKANLTLGTTAGDNLVKANLNNCNSKNITFKTTGKPDSPARLQYISGNLQNSPAGIELEKPFVVKLLDNYNNIIPNHPVIFKVKVGKGYFPGNKSTYVTKTDCNGMAKGYFTLKSEPGFNSVNVFAKGLKRSKVEFEALGQ